MMRKFAWLLMLLTALLPLSASALSQEEWNQQCRSKTNGAVTVYRIDTAENGEKTAREIDTISAGQYVAVSGADYDLEMRLILYYDDGEEKSGYVQKDAPIISATQPVYFTDGTILQLPEALGSDQAALKAYAARYWPELILCDSDEAASAANEAYATTSQPSEMTDESEQPAAQETPAAQGTAEDGKDAADAAATQEPDAVQYLGEDVTIVQLGMATSTVLVSGEMQDVPTSALSFGSNTAADKRIAVIWTPNAGQCTLRSEPSNNAESLGKCEAGMIVGVLEPGEKYTKIICQNKIGYVQSTQLQFHSGDEAVLGTGMLTYNGNGNGKTTINVRCDADQGTEKVAEWKTGTLVTVLSQSNGWYEIEREGLRGYVMEKFLTMQE